MMSAEVLVRRRVSSCCVAKRNNSSSSATAFQLQGAGASQGVRLLCGLQNDRRQQLRLCGGGSRSSNILNALRMS